MKKKMVNYMSSLLCFSSINRRDPCNIEVSVTIKYTFPSSLTQF